MTTAAEGTNTLPDWNTTAPTPATALQQPPRTATTPVPRARSILSTVNQNHQSSAVQFIRLRSAVTAGNTYEYKPFPTDEILCNLTLYVKFQTDSTISTELYYNPGTPQGRRHIFNRKNFAFSVHLRDNNQGRVLCLCQKELEMDSAGYRPPNSHSPWFYGDKINYQVLWQTGFDDNDDSEDNVYLTYTLSLSDV